MQVQQVQLVTLVYVLLWQRRQTSSGAKIVGTSAKSGAIEHAMTHQPTNGQISTNPTHPSSAITYTPHMINTHPRNPHARAT